MGPKSSTVICPIAEAQVLLNKIKEEGYVGISRFESCSTGIKVREFELIFDL